MDRRVLVATDNLAGLGVICKGRSSRREMLQAARQLGAISLAYGTRFYMRWVPSKRNWADGPSRQRPIQDSIEAEVSPLLVYSDLYETLEEFKAGETRSYHG